MEKRLWKGERGKKDTKQNSGIGLRLRCCWLVFCCQGCFFRRTTHQSWRSQIGADPCSGQVLGT